MPKRQAYPQSRISVGAVLYSCSAWTDDAGKTTTAINEWVVRSIQSKRGSKSRMGVAVRSFSEVRQYVNLIEKVDGVTWGKRSPKIGDYGWLKNIPAYCRKQFPVGSELPFGIFTTVRAAVSYQLHSSIQLLAQCTAEELSGRDDEEIADLEREIPALRRRLAKVSGAKGGAKSPVAASLQKYSIEHSNASH